MRYIGQREGSRTPCSHWSKRKCISSSAFSILTLHSMATNHDNHSTPTMYTRYTVLHQVPHDIHRHSQAVTGLCSSRVGLVGWVESQFYWIFRHRSDNPLAYAYLIVDQLNCTESHYAIKAFNTCFTSAWTIGRIQRNRLTDNSEGARLSGSLLVWKRFL
jgi:hypothetical protein